MTIRPLPPLDLNKKVLLQSWAMLSVYDLTASHLKLRFINRRTGVITLTLFATIASILIGILQNKDLAVIFGIVAITFPIVGSYLMNDVIKFSGTTSWIKYRYAAEMMRMHLYLYRMKAGIYADGPPHERDARLVKQLAAARDEVEWDEVIPPSVREPTEESAIKAAIEKANSTTPDDKGLDAITIENYISWRVDSQRKWYTSKTDEDFNRLKLSFRLSQIFLLFGALLSALAGLLDIQVVVLVAVANAFSVALVSWSTVSMSGKTYGLFYIASQQLGDHTRYWSSFEASPDHSDPGKRETETKKFAEHVENILLWERQKWYELALQAQATSDKIILSDLARLTRHAEEAQRTEPDKPDDPQEPDQPGQEV